MLSQTEYIDVAKKVIRRYGKPTMLKDNEAIGEVVNYIMRADLRYDPNKGMNPNSWRMLNGKYGVLVFLARAAKQKTFVSIDDVGAGSDGFMQSIYVNEIFNIVESDEEISDREREIFYDRHRDRLSLRKIGAKHKLTHERIRQILDNIYNKIRIYYEG